MHRIYKVSAYTNPVTTARRRGRCVA